MNERFKADFGFRRVRAQVCKDRLDGSAGGLLDASAVSVGLNGTSLLAASLNNLRESLVQAIKSDILPACQDAIVRTRGVNDNTSPIVLRATRIAQMAVAGTPAEQILNYIDSQPLSQMRKASLLEAAAQRIGIGWECDALNFVDVTIAVGRLQGVYRRLINKTATPAPRRKGGTVLITTAPGEEHLFGILFVEDLYRAAGWTTKLASPKTPAEWVKCTSASGFDTICVSWSGKALAELLSNALRNRKFNRRTTIIAGGQAALEHADWLENQGVDLVSNSPKAALDFSRRSLFNQNQLDHHEIVHHGG